eukprot:5070623-Prymnesium_polylepis.1
MAAEATGSSAAPRLLRRSGRRPSQPRDRVAAACAASAPAEGVLAAHPPRLASARHPPHAHPLCVRLPAGGRGAWRSRAAHRRRREDGGST